MEIMRIVIDRLSVDYSRTPEEVFNPSRSLRENSLHQ